MYFLDCDYIYIVDFGDRKLTIVNPKVNLCWKLKFSDLANFTLAEFVDKCNVFQIYTQSHIKTPPQQQTAANANTMGSNTGGNGSSKIRI